MHVRVVAGKFLDRINRIDRILAWRTGEAGGILGFLHPALSRLRRSLRSGYPDSAEGGPKLFCISCTTLLENNLVNPVNPV